MWRWGTFAFVMGSLMNFASFGFAPAVVVAAIEAIQFVTNIIFGKFLLKKHINARMYAGTVLIVVSVLAIVLTVEMAVALAAAEHTVWTVDTLMNNYATNITFLVYAACMLCFAGFLYPLNAWLRKKNLENKINGTTTWMEPAEPIVYAVFSGIFGTQAVVQAKALFICVENVAFDHYFLYVTLVLWLCFVGVWIYRLNGGLKRYNPLFIIPLLHCNFIVFAIISGGIFFQEFAALTEAWQWACFLAGMSGMIAGLYLVRPGKEPPQPDSMEPMKGKVDDGAFSVRNIPDQTSFGAETEKDEESGAKIVESPQRKSSTHQFVTDAIDGVTGATYIHGPGLTTRGDLDGRYADRKRRASNQSEQRASAGSSPGGRSPVVTAPRKTSTIKDMASII
jgi:hypothetical protein